MLLFVIIMSVVTKALCVQLSRNMTTDEKSMVVMGAPVPQRRAAEVSGDLVENLRRQLMRNNYDYQTGANNDVRKHSSTRKISPIYRQQRFHIQANRVSNESQILRSKLGDRRREQQHLRDHNFVYDINMNNRPARPASRDPKYTEARDSYEQERRDSKQVMRAALDGNFAEQESKQAKNMRDALGPTYMSDKRGKHYPSDKQSDPEEYNPTNSKQRRVAYDNQQHERTAESVYTSYALNKPLSKDSQYLMFKMQKKPMTKDEMRDLNNRVTYEHRGRGRTDEPRPSGEQEPRDMRSDYDDSEVSKLSSEAYDLKNRRATQVMRSGNYYKPVTDIAPRVHPIDKTDLLYYMDDGRLRRNNDVSVVETSRRLAKRNNTEQSDSLSGEQHVDDVSAISVSQSGSREIATNADVSSYSATESTIITAPGGDVTENPTTNVTYKLIKPRAHGGARRRGGARQFLEERKPEGVALISLDHGPLPQFRLPAMRRQYMHDHHDKRPPLADANLHHRHHHNDKQNSIIANKSLEFVQNIREDLRRNNDDYAALEYIERQQKASKPGGMPPKYESPKRMPLKQEPTNRILPKQQSPNRILPKQDSSNHVLLKQESSIRLLPKQESQIRKESLNRILPKQQSLYGKPPMEELPKRVQLMRTATNNDPSLKGIPEFHLPKVPLDTRRNLNNTKNKTNANANLFRANLEHPKHFKKVRVDKLKRLINKGKNRLRELARTATDAAGNTSPYPSPHAGPDDNAAANQDDDAALGEDKIRSPKTHSMLPHPFLTTRAVLPQVVADPSGQKAGQQPGHAAQPLPALSNEVVLHPSQRVALGAAPSPDQIDMAPARGSHVHSMRLKGRLCQRSVLHPEGPLYNSHGNTIMPAHKPELAKGRDFPQTRPPAILLPRCCNCCKKSVLGCQ